MNDYQTYLIDIDGVIWRGTRLLPGAAAFVAWLDATGRDYRYISNNSMIAPAELAQQLRQHGIPALDQRVVTASSAAMAVLAARFPGGRVWVTGLPSLREMAARVGLHVLNRIRGDAPDDAAMSAESAQVVLVGLDRSLTYAGLQQATRALLAGAAFISVNRDPQLPVEDGFDPGCGAILAALEVASRRRAESIGKPSPTILEAALAEMRADPAQAAIIGDALEMDIAAGQAAGIATILALSGLSSVEDARHADPPPTLVVRDLAELLTLVQHDRG